MITIWSRIFSNNRDYIMPKLVNQHKAMPTRKVAAGAIILLFQIRKEVPVCHRLKKLRL